MLQISAPDGGSPSSIRRQIVDLIGEDDADKFYELYRANYVAEKDIAAIAAWGYDHVRLPFHYLDVWDPETETIREERVRAVQRVPRVVPDVRAGGDPRHARRAGRPELAATSATATEWHGSGPSPTRTRTGRSRSGPRSRGATRTRRSSSATTSSTSPSCRRACRRATSATSTSGWPRPSAPSTRTTSCLSRATTTRPTSARSRCPSTTTMVYAFHKYWNAPDQGSIQYLLDLREQTGVPLWLGETGENSNPWFYATPHAGRAQRDRVELVDAQEDQHHEHAGLARRTRPATRPSSTTGEGTAPGPSADSRTCGALRAGATGLDLDQTVAQPRRARRALQRRLRHDGTAVPGPPPSRAPSRPSTTTSEIRASLTETRDPWAVSGTPGSGNTGGAYRNDGVDIEASTDPQGCAYNVGWIETSNSSATP